MWMDGLRRGMSKNLLLSLLPLLVVMLMMMT
jgi:hypothetical protein